MSGPRVLTQIVEDPATLTSPIYVPGPRVESGRPRIGTLVRSTERPGTKEWILDFPTQSLPPVHDELGWVWILLTPSPSHSGRDKNVLVSHRFVLSLDLRRD